MFDLLKKKIAGFTHKILGSTQTEEKKPEETLSPTPNETRSTSEKPIEEKINETRFPTEEKVEEMTRVAESEEEPASEIVPPIHATHLPEIQQHEKREIAPKVGVFQKIGGLFTGTITLNEDTVRAFLEEFEFSLLEADVEMTTTHALIEELQKRLGNKVISSRENPGKIIRKEIKAALYEMIRVSPFDLDTVLNNQHPGIVLILGPNGAGKTTTIAKLTHRFQTQGKKIVLASADTFRAGSIEQLQTHAQRLGVRLVKHQYGADPAAVAFDAVKAARAENADIVLIDTAGRQDTNKNLLEELKKIQRVIQPHAKIYIGESYTGQAILTQARTFDEAVGIDGFILTKLDTDTKGGGVLSILHNLQKPILFFGVGQAYEDLIPFDLDEFLNRLIPENE